MSDAQSTRKGGDNPAASLDAGPILKLRGISKRFGAVQALTLVDFDVYTGEVVALVGDNGAGKSTLIKCIAGTHMPDEGQIFFEGRGGKDPHAGGRDAARDRDRLPGSRALRQPRRRRGTCTSAARRSRPSCPG